MTRFYYKNKGNNNAEAWLEDGRHVYCFAKLITTGKKQCLIDTIDTNPKFLKQGHATNLVKHLQKQFDEVAPICVLPTAKGFWDKLGMKDALGDEE